MTILTKRNFMIAGGTTIVLAGAALAFRGCALDRLVGFGELPPTPIYAEDGLAIRGTDPVAYFREGRPVTGDAAFEADWKGARWRFVSARNRDDFLSTPDRFAPQYGGFCAWAVAARGKLYSTQPENWSVVDGKLYLNFNDDIQRKWEADVAGFITRADGSWPEIVHGMA